jgi:hypothetical protein
MKRLFWILPLAVLFSLLVSLRFASCQSPYEPGGGGL